MKDLDEKLREIGLIPLREEFEGCSSGDVNHIEGLFGQSLPNDYKWFISKYGEGFISGQFGFKAIEDIPWASKDGLCEITYFYSGRFSNPDGIFSIKKRYTDQIDDQLLPIAESPGGNQVCLSFRPEDLGSILFWDHEAPIGEGLYLVAGSFKDFIFSFSEFSNSGSGSPKILKTRISDDF